MEELKRKARTDTVRLDANILDEVRKKLEEQKQDLVSISTSMEYQDSHQSEDNPFSIFGGKDPVDDVQKEDFFEKEENYSRKITETRQVDTTILADLMKEHDENFYLKKEDEDKLHQEENNVNQNHQNEASFDRDLRRATMMSLENNFVEKQEGIYWLNETPLCGFLISYDKNPNGDFYELRYGKLMITNGNKAQGNSLIIKNESVSPMHAVMKLSEDEISLLDQFSETGTKVKHQGETEFIELSGNREKIKDKDVIIFGNVSFKICLI